MTTSGGWVNHAKAVRKHQSRVRRELGDLITQARLIEMRLEAGQEIDVEVAHGLVDKAAVIAERIGMLEVLREALAWHGSKEAGR